jgi:hypothetical protein
MLISEFIKSLKGCRHTKIGINTAGEYCPDCGQFIVSKWYLIRCSCCGVKRIAYLDLSDNVKPVEKFCPNCGSVQTTIKELNKINFVDINFAVHKREIIEPECSHYATQVWEDKENTEEQALLGLKSA